MDYWAGELGTNYIKNIKHVNVMDSVYNYLKLDEPKIEYPYKNLFLDNGAFSIFKNNYHRNKKKITIPLESIINIQEKFSPLYTVPFDYPIDPQMNFFQMDKNWKKTVENIDYWSGSTDLNLIPALHAWNKASINKNMHLLYKKGFNYVALGSAFILKKNFKGYFGDRQPNKNIYEAFLYLAALGRKLDVDIHIFGLGSSPLIYHIAAFCGIKSTDSSGYRRKAAYGKIILPQTGERYAGNGSAYFGVNRNKGLNYKNIFSEDEKIKLKNCKCPECRKIERNGYLKWKYLCSDWTIRAIHNKWVMEQEEKISEQYIEQGWDIYEQFIDKMMEHSHLKHLWNFVKENKKKFFC